MVVNTGQWELVYSFPFGIGTRHQPKSGKPGPSLARQEYSFGKQRTAFERGVGSTPASRGHNRYRKRNPRKKGANKMKRRVIYISTAIVMAVVVLLAVQVAKKNRQERTSTGTDQVSISVTVASVAQREFQDEIRAVGTLKARETVLLNSKVSGNVEGRISSLPLSRPVPPTRVPKQPSHRRKPNSNRQRRNTAELPIS
jgi:cell division protein FtsB